LQALRAGHSVIATSRNPSKTPDLVSEVKKLGGVWLSLDVTAPDASSVVQSALKIHGHIDYFINNAGYSLLGAVEDMRHVPPHLLNHPRLTKTARKNTGTRWKSTSSPP
jgi:NAD(P)-dependent dehydrogenase (short-subunit alcohol dehydrogenase family)